MQMHSIHQAMFYKFLVHSHLYHKQGEPMHHESIQHIVVYSISTSLQLGVTRTVNKCTIYTVYVLYNTVFAIKIRTTILCQRKSVGNKMTSVDTQSYPSLMISSADIIVTSTKQQKPIGTTGSVVRSCLLSTRINDCMVYKI